MSFGGGQSPYGDWAMQPGQIPFAWANAKNIARNPFHEYPGMRSAGVNSTLSAGGNAALGVAGYQPQMIQPWQMGNVPGMTAAQMGGVPNVTGAQVAPVGNVSAGMGMGGIDAYMNPALDSVINASLSDIDRQRQMSLNQGASNAAMSGAFGGDRHGVADSLTNEAYGRIAADTASGLRMGAYDTAAGLMQSDYDRMLQAALANQGAGLTQAGQNAGFAQQANLANQGVGYNVGATNAGLQQDANATNTQLGYNTALANAQLGQGASLANQSAGLQGAGVNLGGAGMLGQIGMNQYGIEQSALDNAYSEFLRQMAFPYQNQDMLLKSLGATGNVMGGQWTPSQNLFADMASGAAQGAGYGLLSMAAMPSDANLKADVKTVGFDAKGRRWVDYRYLWDEPGTVRRGVIAQEVLETDPEAVSRHPEGGFLMVDYSKLS